MPPPAHLRSRRQQKIWEQQQKENASKRQKRESYVNQSPFRYEERYFKARVPPPDFSRVIDFHCPDKAKQLVQEVPLTADLRQLSSIFGDPNETEWKERWQRAYVLNNCNGLIVIPNPFSADRQRDLVRRCLSEYSRPPNKSNLDPHYEIPAEGLWQVYQRDAEQAIKKTQGNVEAAPDAYGIQQSDDSHTSTYTPVSELLRKLRWITLGYQYHWGTKEYCLDQRYSMPADLAELSSAVVGATEGVGANGWKNTYKRSDFKAEAGVINYYQLRDTLMGHVDRSELNMDAPLVSVSFGHSCIYLLGGPTRETTPVPIRLHSGDILAMTGESRKAFHGVPRILEDTLPDYLSACAEGAAADWEQFGSYMSTSRINLNIRQVFPADHDDKKQNLDASV